MNYRKGISINLILILCLSVFFIIVTLPENQPENRLEIHSEKQSEKSQEKKAESQPEEQPEKQPAADISREEIELLQYHVSGIAAIAVINESSRFGLMHNEGRISLEPVPADVDVSIEALQSYLYKFSKLKTLGQVTNPREESVYGLDEPRAQVTFFLTTGEKVRLFLGNRNSLDGSFYLRLDSQDSVYLVSESDAGLFLASPASFMESGILPGLELEDMNDLISLELNFKNESLPSFRIENRGNFTFKMTRPFFNTVDYERILSDLIFPVITIASYGSEKISNEITASDIEKELSLTLQLNDEIYNLFFFMKDGGFYLGREGVRNVLELDKEAVPFMAMHYLDLLNGSIYHSNVSEIEELQIQDSVSLTDYNISLTGESVNLEGTVNGVSVGYSELMDFFQILLHTGISRELLDASGKDSNAALSVLIYKKNGTMDKLDFVSVGDGEHILYVNGVAHFLTYNKDVKDIRSALNKLVLKGIGE